MIPSPPSSPQACALLQAGYEARSHILSIQARLRRHDPRLARPELSAALAERLHTLEELCAEVDGASALAAHELRVRARAELEVLSEIQHGCEELLAQCELIKAGASSTDQDAGAQSAGELHESYPQEPRRPRLARSARRS